MFIVPTKNVACEIFQKISTEIDQVIPRNKKLPVSSKLEQTRWLMLNFIASEAFQNLVWRFLCNSLYRDVFSNTW